MTLGPSRSLGLLRWGIGGPNTSMSLESSQHIYESLPKRPYLVRQQQYVSGTSREEKEGGYIRCSQIFRNLIPGSRYWLPLQDVLR